MTHEQYYISKFFELGFYPQYNSFNNTYQCACPICREGKSLRKKKRCYFIPEKNIIYCHNCGWSSKPIKWISQITGLLPSQIKEEINNTCDNFEDILKEEPILKQLEVDTLPKNSINLFDPAQVAYFKDNSIVLQALEYIKKRRLDTAINKPPALYISLDDKYQKNRIIIPFFNENKDIEFYQTRVFLENDGSNITYYSKLNSNKTLFNIDNIDFNQKYVFILEGPFDAFFIRNSVALAGINKGSNTLTTRQSQQFNTTLKFLNKIWIFDSQHIDKTSYVKTKNLLEIGENVFIWPKTLGQKFKDINELCVFAKKDEIIPDFILKNTFNGLEGLVLLETINKQPI